MQIKNAFNIHIEIVVVISKYNSEHKQNITIKSTTHPSKSKANMSPLIFPLKYNLRNISCP